MTVLERVEVVVDVDSPVDAALVRQGTRDILVLSPHPSFEVATANVAELLRVPPDVAARVVREHLPEATRMSALLGVQETIGSYVPLHADLPKSSMPRWGRAAILGVAMSAVILPGVGVFAANTMDDTVPAHTSLAPVTSGDGEVSIDWRCKPRMDIKQVRCTSPDGATWNGVFTVVPAITVTMDPSADTSAVVDPVTGHGVPARGPVSPQTGSPLASTPAQSGSGSVLTQDEKTLPMPDVRVQIESALRISLANLLGSPLADASAPDAGPRSATRSAVPKSVMVQVDLGGMTLPEPPSGKGSGSELTIKREQEPVTPPSKGSQAKAEAEAEAEPRPAENPAPAPVPTPTPAPQVPTPTPNPTPSSTSTPEPPPAGNNNVTPEFSAESETPSLHEPLDTLINDLILLVAVGD